MGTKIEITVYDTEDKLLANLRNDSLTFDLVMGATTLQLPKFVVGDLIQPLNREYLTNFDNVLDSLQSPYYDVGSKYTPVVYTTGVAYRRDIIDDSAFAGDDGWKLLWDPAYKGYVGVLDDPREALTLGMYSQGSPTRIPAIRRSSTPRRPRSRSWCRRPTLASTSSPGSRSPKAPRTSTRRGRATWSPRSTTSQGTDAEVLGYWKPSRTTVANDFFVIPARSERPVMAALINYLLDPANCAVQLRVRGLPTRAQEPDPRRAGAAELVPSHLLSTLVSDEDVANGFRLDALSLDVENLWTEAYSRIRAG